MTPFSQCGEDTPIGRRHRWTNEPAGRPLHCADCGVVWPGDPDWPPTPVPGRNPGYGDLTDFMPWGDRVERVVTELRRM